MYDSKFKIIHIYLLLYPGTAPGFIQEAIFILFLINQCSSARTEAQQML